MKKAVVRLFWTKSVSTDVVVQKVKVIDVGTGEIVVDTTVTPEVEVFFVKLSENTKSLASVVANDGTYDSVPATVEVVIGDLSAPQPVSGLGFEVTEVVEE